MYTIDASVWPAYGHVVHVDVAACPELQLLDIGAWRRGSSLQILHSIAAPGRLTDIQRLIKHKVDS